MYVYVHVYVYMSQLDGNLHKGLPSLPVLCFDFTRDYPPSLLILGGGTGEPAHMVDVGGGVLHRAGVAGPDRTGAEWLGVEWLAHAGGGRRLLSLEKILLRMETRKKTILFSSFHSPEPRCKVWCHLE